MNTKGVDQAIDREAGAEVDADAQVDLRGDQQARVDV